MADKPFSAPRDNLSEVTQSFHDAGARYYTSQQADQYGFATEEAAKAFREAAVPYADALDEYEKYLLSVGRDKVLEAELRQLLTRKEALKVILDNLNKLYPPE
jgi:hypothetical protein